MAVTFCPFPLPVVTPLGEGYVVYITEGPMWENDCITVALKEGGQWFHFSSKDIKSFHNSTYGIKKKQSVNMPKKPKPKPKPVKGY